MMMKKSVCKLDTNATLPYTIVVRQNFLDFFGADTAREKHLSRAVSAPKKPKIFFFSNFSAR